MQSETNENFQDTPDPNKGGEDNRRKFSRRNVNLEKNLTLVGQPKNFPVIDISYGGMSILSDHKMEVGSASEMMFGSAKIHVKILACKMIELDSIQMIFAYKVRAEFMTEEYEVTKILVDLILSQE